MNDLVVVGETKKNKISRVIDTFVFILPQLFLYTSIMLIFFGSQIYWVGFHNLDLGQNIRYINAETGNNYFDINSQFKSWNSTTMYITGSNQQNIGVYILNVGFMFFGISSTIILLQRKQV